MSTRSRRRKNQAPHPVIDTGLSLKEKMVFDNINISIEALQKLASAEVNFDFDKHEKVSSAFDRQAEKTRRSIEGTNLDLLLAGEDSVAECLTVMLVELKALGLLDVEVFNFMSLGVDGEELFQAHQGLISAYESFPEDLKKIRVQNDRHTAAIVLGVYLARGGSDIFADLPWQSHNFNECLVAVQVAGAVVAQYSQIANGGDPYHEDEYKKDALSDFNYEVDELRYDLAISEVESLLTAVKIPLAKIEKEDFIALPIYNTNSRLIEEVLQINSSSWELDEEDLHRLSAQILPAFFEGRDDRELGEQDAYEEGNELLQAAYEVGQFSRDYLTGVEEGKTSEPLISSTTKIRLN
jgi:hypothetical protein